MCKHWSQFETVNLYFQVHECIACTAHQHLYHMHVSPSSIASMAHNAMMYLTKVRHDSKHITWKSVTLVHSSCNDIVHASMHAACTDHSFFWKQLHRSLSIICAPLHQASPAHKFEVYMHVLTWPCMMYAPCIKKPASAADPFLFLWEACNMQSYAISSFVCMKEVPGRHQQGSLQGPVKKWIMHACMTWSAHVTPPQLQQSSSASGFFRRRSEQACMHMTTAWSIYTTVCSVPAQFCTSAAVSTWQSKPFSTSSLPACMRV